MLKLLQNLPVGKTLKMSLRSFIYLCNHNPRAVYSVRMG